MLLLCCFYAAFIPFRISHKSPAHKGRNVLNRHTLNMIILSAVEFTDQELSTLNIIGLCRFNSSGDIQSNTMALNYFRIAANNPHCKFALWVKNVAAVKHAMAVCGKPENLTLIFSNPIINGRPILPGGFDYTFSVYTPGKIDSVLSTGDYMECNGKKCKECGYKCYLKLWPAGANLEQLVQDPGQIIDDIKHDDMYRDDEYWTVKGDILIDRINDVTQRYLDISIYA